MEMTNRQRKYILQSLVYFAAIMLFAHIASAALTATPSQFTLSNTIIDVGQISIANTVISGGSSGPYFGQWSWESGNLVNNGAISTITVGSDPAGIAFNPQGTIAYVTNEGSGTVNVINTATNTVINTISVGSSSLPRGVAFNPSGTLAYVANDGAGTVNVINVATNTVVNTITVGSSPFGVAFSPSGTYAYVANYGSGTVSVINVATNTVTNTITVGSSPQGVAFSPSGALAYVTNYGSDTVSVINPATNTVISTITVGTAPRGVAFTPSGTIAYVINSGSDTVSVINVATNTIINTITGSVNPAGVAFNPSGTLAYVANYGSFTINVTDVATNTVINTITVGTSPYGIAFNPSGTFAYVTNVGSSSVSVIGSLPETAQQPLPASNDLQLILNAVSSNELSVTFNGVAYTGQTGASSIYGQWSLFGFADDANGIGGSDGGYASQTFYNVGNTLLLSNTLTINPALTVPSISPYNPTIADGQSITLTGSWTGGTPDYTVTWYTGPSGNSCSQDSGNVLATYSGISASYNSLSISPATTNSYCIKVTDSAITPVSQLSANMVVSIGSQLQALTLTPSNPTITAGQSVTFTASWSGGIPTYGASLYSSSTSACSQQSTLVQQQIGISADTATFSAVTPSSGTYYCVFVTDNTTNSYVVVNTIPHSGFSNPQGIAISPDGSFAYVTNQYGNNVKIINIATNSIVNTISSTFFVDGSYASHPGGVAFAPSGTYAYVSNHAGNIVIINTATNTAVGDIPNGFNNPIGIAFTPNGAFAYVVNSGSSNVVMVNTSTNTVTGAITTGFNNPTGIAITPDAKYLYVDNNDGSSANIVIINTTTDAVVGSISGGIGSPYGIAIAPSGTYAYVTNMGLPGNMVIVNLATNTILGTITSDINNPREVAFTPNGAFAYIADLDGTVTSPTQNVSIISTGPEINHNTVYVTVNQKVSNPYAGGSTGFFGHLPGATTATTSASSTSTTTVHTTVPVTMPSVTSAGAVEHLCNGASGYRINYPSLNTTFEIKPGAVACFNITASNASPNSIPSLSNRSAIMAINYTFSNRNISVNVSINYPCGTAPSDLTPFILRNGTWQEITPFTVNVVACTVTFAAPADPVIALFNTNSTSATTTLNTTTTEPATTSPAPGQQQSNTGLIVAIVIIVAIILIAIVAYLKMKR
jgi:YVTN family beta-propeller protein